MLLKFVFASAHQKAVPFFWIIALVLSGGWGLVGRWILLHPDRVFKGLFTRDDKLLTRIAGVETTLVGTFMVFSAAIGVVFYLALLMRLPDWLALLVGIAVGDYIGFRVYGNVRRRLKAERN